MKNLLELTCMKTQNMIKSLRLACGNFITNFFMGKPVNMEFALIIKYKNHYDSM